MLQVQQCLRQQSLLWLSLMLIYMSGLDVVNGTELRNEYYRLGHDGLVEVKLSGKFVPVCLMHTTEYSAQRFVAQEICRRLRHSSYFQIETYYKYDDCWADVAYIDCGSSRTSSCNLKTSDSYCCYQRLQVFCEATTTTSTSSTTSYGRGGYGDRSWSVGKIVGVAAGVFVGMFMFCVVCMICRRNKHSDNNVRAYEQAAALAEGQRHVRPHVRSSRAGAVAEDQRAVRPLVVRGPYDRNAEPGAPLRPQTFEMSPMASIPSVVSSTGTDAANETRSGIVGDLPPSYDEAMRATTPVVSRRNSLPTYDQYVHQGNV